MKNNPMVVLVVRPGEKPILEVIDGSIESMQELVGGDVRTLSLSRDSALICYHEDAKMKGEPLNRALYDGDGAISDVLAGTFFVCRESVNGDAFLGLSNKLIHKYAEMFNNVDRVTDIMVDGKTLIQNYDPAPTTYLGVGYQFHLHESSTDIEFYRDSKELESTTIDWHTVEDGTEESKHIYDVAKMWAGNLAIKEAHAVLGIVKAEETVDKILESAKEKSNALTGESRNRQAEKEMV